ncbi:MAG TPA: hypothetical protein DEV81_24565 [Cyanobacteria bacterium UBA11049]|nr:hypothetical protein [Cyanobacteria bacterium UBA11049]
MFEPMSMAAFEHSGKFMFITAGFVRAFTLTELLIAIDVFGLLFSGRYSVTILLAPLIRLASSS